MTHPPHTFTFTFNNVSWETRNVISRMMYLYEGVYGHPYYGHPLTIYSIFFTGKKMGYWKHLTNDAETAILKAMRAVAPHEQGT